MQNGRIGSRQQIIGGTNGSQNSSVPSPAPNASSTILAGGGRRMGGAKGQLAKLAFLGNGAASILHSTPIGEGNRK